MQQHQQWIENQCYIEHLKSIKRIKSRRNQSSVSSLTWYKKNQDKQTTKSTNTKTPMNYEKLEDLKEYDQKQKYQPSTQRRNCTNIMSKILKIPSNRFQYCKNTNNFIQSLNQSYRNSVNKFYSAQNNNKKCILNKNKQKKSLTIRQKQILWQNFLLGKRLIQTSPVICKKKLDEDYKKHKRLVKISTQNKMQYKQNSNFRFKKLKQFNDSIIKVSDAHRLENNQQLNKYIITLIIQNIQIFKFKVPNFQDVVVTMQSGKMNHEDKQNQQNTKNKIHKSLKQVSECIPSALLTSYHFYFTYKKSQFKANLVIIIQVRNVKNLNVHTVGTFCFQFNQQKEINSENTVLFNAGRPIGEVKFRAKFSKKSQLKSELQYQA